MRALRSIWHATSLAYSSNPVDDDASRDYLENMFSHADHPESPLRDTFDRKLDSGFIDVDQG